MGLFPYRIEGVLECRNTIKPTYIVVVCGSIDWMFLKDTNWIGLEETRLEVQNAFVRDICLACFDTESLEIVRAKSTDSPLLGAMYPG